MLPPSSHEKPSPALQAQIDRDFGSMEDFRRTLGKMTADGRRGGWVWLVCTPGGRLRLVQTPPHGKPGGVPLFRFPVSPAPPPPQPPPPPPRPNWRDASERFDRHMGRRPPYPMP